MFTNFPKTVSHYVSMSLWIGAKGATPPIKTYLCTYRPGKPTNGIILTHKNHFCGIKRAYGGLKKLIVITVFSIGYGFKFPKYRHSYASSVHYPADISHSKRPWHSTAVRYRPRWWNGNGARIRFDANPCERERRRTLTIEVVRIGLLIAQSVIVRETPRTRQKPGGVPSLSGPSRGTGWGIVRLYRMGPLYGS